MFRNVEDCATAPRVDPYPGEFVMGVDKEAKHTVLFKGDDKGFGWKTRYLVPAEDMAMATRCEMTDKP